MMNPIRLLAAVLLAAAALLLPSCVLYSHTGDRLRDPCTTYTGVDIYHPVDGKIHYDPKAAGNIDSLKRGVISEGYVIANEITFNRRSRTMNSDSWYPSPPLAGNYKPTGRQLVVKITSSGCAGALSALPKGLASMDAPRENIEQKGDGVLYEWHPDGEPTFGRLGRTAAPVETLPGWWRRRAINCCDYFVDPLLTGVYNTVFWGVGIPVGLVITPIGAPVNILCTQQQQQEAASAGQGN